MKDCTDQSLEDASSNRIPICADSFERPEGPQHTNSWDRVTHGCFDLYKSSLAGCMQANGLAADACSGLKDSFFGVESKQKLMAGGSALLLFYKKVGVSGHLEIGSSPHHTSPYLTSPHRTAPHHTTPHHATPQNITGIAPKASCLANHHARYATIFEISDTCLLTIHSLVAR
jgi:hypothetical protein